MREPQERLQLVTSPLLGAVSHGFSTRIGGVSKAPYDTLNLGKKWGDEASAVEENLTCFCAYLGFDRNDLYLTRQVHGDVIIVVDEQTPAQIAEQEADAMISRRVLALGIGTADCVPLLFYDQASGQIGAAHAGWRGTVQNIAGKVVHALVEGGARAECLRVALGPCICCHCFEVGEEVASQFDPICRESVMRDRAKPHVDLRQVNVALLVAAGVRREHIDGNPPCTMCEPAQFFSYRRDGAKTGAQLSVISLAAKF